MAKTISSCVECPFMKPVGHYYPVEWSAAVQAFHMWKMERPILCFPVVRDIVQERGIPPFCPVAKHSRVTFELTKK